MSAGYYIAALRCVSQAHNRLHTPGLFVHSYEACTGQPLQGKQPRSKQQLRQLMQATAAVRWAVDTGQPIPEHVSPHQVGSCYNCCCFSCCHTRAMEAVGGSLLQRQDDSLCLAEI
jgi:hypothetical protein